MASRKSGNTNKTAHVLNVIAGASTPRPEAERPQTPAAPQEPAAPPVNAIEAAPAVEVTEPVVSAPEAPAEAPQAPVAQHPVPPILQVARAADESLSSRSGMPWSRSWKRRLWQQRKSSRPRSRPLPIFRRRPVLMRRQKKCPLPALPPYPLVTAHHLRKSLPHPQRKRPPPLQPSRKALPLHPAPLPQQCLPQSRSRRKPRRNCSMSM